MLNFGVMSPLRKNVEVMAKSKTFSDRLLLDQTRLQL